MFYKHHNGIVTISSSAAPTADCQMRSRRLSHSTAYDVPSHRTLYRQKTFFPRTIPEWNSLPEDVASAPSLEDFRSGLRRILY